MKRSLVLVNILRAVLVCALIYLSIDCFMHDKIVGGILWCVVLALQALSIILDNWDSIKGTNS